MPYEIAWKTGGVIWTFYGTLTGKDAIQANLDIYGDPRFDDLRYSIVDITGVAHFSLAIDDLNAAAALDDAATLSNHRLIVAVVAASREAITVAKAYEAAMRTAAWDVNILPTMEDAVAWVCSLCGIGSADMDDHNG